VTLINQFCATFNSYISLCHCQRQIKKAFRQKTWNSQPQKEERNHKNNPLFKRKVKAKEENHAVYNKGMKRVGFISN